MRIFTIFILLVNLFSCGGKSSRKNKGSLPVEIKVEEENKMFDLHNQAPLELLKKAYHESKVLFLGYPTHSLNTQYLFLRELLEEVGHDTSLKHIVLERFHDNSAFYSDLSLKPFSELKPKLDRYFPNKISKKQSICRSIEWNYSITEFMPYLMNLNKKKRPNNNPLVAISLDGASAQHDIQFWPRTALSLQSVAQGCINSVGLLTYVQSATREMKTAENFKTFYDSLKEGEKAIVLYNSGHIYRGFDACLGYMDHNLHWKIKRGPGSWIDFFLKDRPDAEKDMKFIFIDGVDKTRNPKGALNFSFRQSARINADHFAIPTAPFKDIFTEKGLEAFRKDSFIFTNDGHRVIRGSMHLDGLFDGIIWHKNTEDNFLLDENLHTILYKTPYAEEICTPLYNSN